MTASERLAEIKADLVEIYDTWGLGDEILIGSRSEIASLSETVQTLVAALEAVLELHKPDWSDWGSDHPWCAACRGYYPCPTVEAVNEALGVDQ